MLQFLQSGEDVLAIKVSNKITGADLDQVMDRLDRLLQERDKVHVFLETYGIDGIELSGLATYSARAMPLLGKLSRFGRIAVVADQAWVRAGAQLESLILPFIAYRTFTPDQREKALAWVEGRTD